jgi:transposase-like protein
MFQPPRCPNRSCSQHRAPQPRFFIRKGFYRALCRSHPVPRFRCRSCQRGFSRQTFRQDYRDHRPALNVPLFLSLASGVGLRQSARNLGLSLGATEHKARKIARHLRRLNLNLRGPLPEGSILQLDELETFEGRRNTRPLSVPVLIERDTRFILWAESAPIRPRGKRTPARERAIAADERRFGPRRDLSRRALRRTLARGAALTAGLSRVVLMSDEKSTYPLLARSAFGARRLVHQQTNSGLARGTWNPLFPINHTEAMSRDLMGRLRRESWLVSKKRRFLDLALQLWAAYRNYVRKRFNRDREESPAQLLGFEKRRLSPREVLAWRQDWGRESIHPTSDGAHRVADRLRRLAVG